MCSRWTTAKTIGNVPYSYDVVEVNRYSLLTSFVIFFYFFFYYSYSWFILFHSFKILNHNIHHDCFYHFPSNEQIHAASRRPECVHCCQASRQWQMHARLAWHAHWSPSATTSSTGVCHVSRSVAVILHVFMWLPNNNNLSMFCISQLSWSSDALYCVCFTRFLNSAHHNTAQQRPGPCLSHGLRRVPQGASCTFKRPLSGPLLNLLPDTGHCDGTCVCGRIHAGTGSRLPRDAI